MASRDQELLAEHARLMDKHGAHSPEAVSFLLENRRHPNFFELAVLARELKQAMTSNPVINNQGKKTCGPYYREAIEQYTKIGSSVLNAELIKERSINCFAAGFIHGQAEKVFNGCCRAAVFRSMGIPGMPVMLQLIRDTINRFNIDAQPFKRLVMIRLFVKDMDDELWICREQWTNDVESLMTMEKNSQDWHVKRAWLCGIPVDEVDVKFHERQSD